MIEATLGGLTVPQLIERGVFALEACRTIDEARRLRAEFAAFSTWAKEQQASQDIIDVGEEMRLRVRRLIAQERDRLPKNKGGRPPKNPAENRQGFDKPPTNAELGLEHREVSDDRRLAKASDAVFEAAIQTAKETGGVNPEKVHRMIEAGVEALAELPPDASASKVTRTLTKAMEKAADVKPLPSPKQADRMARETGESVWGSDGYMHDGIVRTEAEKAEHAAFGRFQNGAGLLADKRRLEPPERVPALTAPGDRDYWRREVIPSALDYLRRVLAAFEAAEAAEQEKRDAA